MALIGLFLNVVVLIHNFDLRSFLLFFCISTGTVCTFIIKGEHGLKGDQRRKGKIFFIF